MVRGDTDSPAGKAEGSTGSTESTPSVNMQATHQWNHLRKEISKPQGTRRRLDTAVSKEDCKQRPIMQRRACLKQPLYYQRKRAPNNRIKPQIQALKEDESLELFKEAAISRQADLFHLRTNGGTIEQESSLGSQSRQPKSPANREYFLQRIAAGAASIRNIAVNQCQILYEVAAQGTDSTIWLQRELFVVLNPEVLLAHLESTNV